MFPQLNLPSIQPRLQQSKGKVWIFDVIRKKYVVLTPEEWVRQHFLHLLIAEKYPKSLMKIESGLLFNELKKRSDIVVHDRLGKPWMIVECKNPLININQLTLQQVAVYNTTLKASFIVVTNGLKHYYFETHWKAGTVKQIEELPAYALFT
jgi:hypothetical protein